MNPKQCILRYPISDIIVSVTSAGIKTIGFGTINRGYADSDRGLMVLGREDLDRQEGSHLDRLINELTRYLNGEAVDFEVELDLAGCTDFQRRVYEAARLIPRGETRSYGWVAERCGSPRGSRAIGQALKRNPVVIVIPCHRVIAGDGGIGGFGSGLDWKRLLLRWESQTAKNKIFQ